MKGKITMNRIKEKIQRAKTFPYFRDLTLLAAIILVTLGVVMVLALALRHGPLKQAAAGSETTPVVDPLATLSETNVAEVLQHGMKARASKQANPCLVVGQDKGTIKNTRRDHSRFWGSLYVGVQAPYEIYYGYRLDIRSMPYRVERENDKIIIYLRPPSLLYRANVNLGEMRIYHVLTTRLRNDSDKDMVARRAQQPLTQMATEEALKKIKHSRQARVHAETVFRDILLDFVGQLDPALVQQFHDLIEIRFEKETEMYADLIDKK